MQVSMVIYFPVLCVKLKQAHKQI